MNKTKVPGLLTFSRLAPFAALSLAMIACSPLTLAGSTLVGHSPGGNDSSSSLASTRQERSSSAVAARTAFLAKDCAALKDGDLDALEAAYQHSPLSLSTGDRVQIAVKLVGCKRDVDLFEKVVSGASWDAFVEAFPKDVDWLARLESYVSAGGSRFPEYNDDGPVTNLWIWVRLAKRDGTSDRLCKTAFPHRGNFSALSAGAPLAFACANAGNSKALAALLPALLSSTSWEARADGCDALALAPQAATPRLAKVVKEMSYTDPHEAWVDDVLTFTVRDKCAIAARKIDLAQ